MANNEISVSGKTEFQTNRLWKMPIQMATALMILAPLVASAHPGHYHPTGEIDEFEALSAGLAHPFGGVDHLLMALAAGWLAFAGKGARNWVHAVSFLGAMLIGGMLGRFAPVGNILEVGLSVSMLATGSLFFMSKTHRPQVFAILLAAAAGIHGFAHGAECPTAMSFAPYMAGIISSTAGLMLAGGPLHKLAATMPFAAAHRIAGAALFAFGFVSLIQTF